MERNQDGTKSKRYEKRQEIREATNKRKAGKKANRRDAHKMADRLIVAEKMDVKLTQRII